MVYYWCEIKFDEQDNVVTRKALEICNGEKELINTFARLVKSEMFSHWLWEYYKPSEALQNIEKTQNLTGKDYSNTGHTLKNRQLVCAEYGSLRVVDVRNWHNQILEEFEKGVSPAPLFRSCRGSKKKQGKTHKSWGGYHWAANTLASLRDIARGDVRHKRAASIKNLLASCDPKIHRAENNWKQVKCRKQWEWHKKRHQDRVCLPEEDKEWTEWDM